MFVACSHKRAQCHTLVAFSHFHKLQIMCLSSVASPAFVLPSSVHVPFILGGRRGGETMGHICASRRFSHSPLSGDERGETAKGERGGGGGESEEGRGHSIGTPRHSEGNHAKYFPLSVVRASRLLLHTHTHIWFEKVLKVNTHKLGESVAHSNTHDS